MKNVLGTKIVLIQYLILLILRSTIKLYLYVNNQYIIEVMRNEIDNKIKLLILDRLLYTDIDVLNY